MESSEPEEPAKPKPRKQPGRRPLHRLRRRVTATGVHVNRFAGWARRTLNAIESAHYRRFIISLIAGFAVLGAMRVPAINESAFGEPDRQMMETAFKIRADQAMGGDPALLIDIDDDTISGVRPSPAGPIRAPAATAPREVVAKALEYLRTAPPGQGAQAVIVDVDFATPTPGDEQGVKDLHQVLADWAQTPSAPPLMLARQSFPDSLMGGDGTKLIIPSTDFDDVVDPAPNIYWSEVKMMADQNSIVRETLPYECPVWPDGKTKPLYSAALLAYGFLVQGQVPKDAPVRHWMESAEADCAGGHHVAILHGELINYHISLGKGENGRVWPEEPKTWKGYKICGANADAPIFRRISAGDVAAAGSDASHDLICQKLVVVGGTNIAADDFEQTPLNEMAGPVIIVNSVTGLELSGGGLKRVPLWLQLTVLFVMSAMITTGFWFTRKIREHYSHLRTRHRGRHWLVRLRLIPFNPLILNWVFALIAYAVGIALLLLSLNLGYWGYLSAPAFASAAVGAMQEFSDDETDEKS